MHYGMLAVVYFAVLYLAFYMHAQVAAARVALGYMTVVGKDMAAAGVDTLGATTTTTAKVTPRAKAKGDTTRVQWW